MYVMKLRGCATCWSSFDRPGKQRMKLRNFVLFQWYNLRILFGDFGKLEVMMKGETDFDEPSERFLMNGR